MSAHSSISHLELFASTTVIRGFSFIKQSKWWVEKIFWICVVFGFAILTVSEVHNSVNKYLREPTISHTTIAKNDTIFLRDPIFCYTIDPTAMRNGFNLSQWDKVDELINYCRGSNITDEFSRRLNDSRPVAKHKAADSADGYRYISGYDTSLVNESEEFVTLLFATTSLISNIARIENYKGNWKHLVDPNRNNWGLFNSITKTVVNSTSLSLFKLSEFFSEQLVDFKQLTKMVATLICSQMNVKLFSYVIDPIFSQNDLSIEFPCATDNVVAFAVLPEWGDLITSCMRVYGSESFRFETYYEPTGLMYKPKNLYVDNYDFQKRGLFIMLDFHESYGAENMEYQLSGLLGMNVAAKTRVIGSYKSASLKRRPCQHGISFAECNGICRSSAFKRRCRCKPISFDFRSKNEENIPSCGTILTKQNYGKPSLNIPYLTEGLCENVTMFGLESKCEDVCVESCETLLLSHLISYDAGILPDPDYYVLVIDKLITFTFPEVVETISMDFRDLITSLGGNLSLWLGASFLALIHIVVFFLKIPFERCLDD